jgi:hypothetical protein
MEAAGSSEMMVKTTRLHGITSQKTAIFIKTPNNKSKLQETYSHGDLDTNSHHMPMYSLHLVSKAIKR